MREFVQKKLSDSPVARWSVVILVSLTMMSGYFLSDVMSPLKTMLEQQLRSEERRVGKEC